MLQLRLCLLAFISNTSLYAQYVSLPNGHFKDYLIDSYPQCFNGSNQLDTTCTAIVNEWSLNFVSPSSSAINFDGLQYFDNLSYLIIRDAYALPNQLPFPPNVRRVNLEFSRIDSLLYLPNSIDTFWTDYCRINYIHQFPSHLKDLMLNIDPSIQYPSIPPLPVSLKRLDIAIADEKMPLLTDSIEELLAYAFFNLSIPPDLPASLKTCALMNTSLSMLPKLPANLESLNISGSSLIECLPELPNTLTFLNASNTQVSCIPNTPNGNSFGLPVCITLNACSPEAKASGTVYHDVNGNNMFEFGTDLLLPGWVIVNTTTGAIASTSQSGIYYIELDTSVVNILKCIVPSNSSSVPDSIVIANPLMGSNVVNSDFAIQLTTPDLMSTISTNPARPGFTHLTTVTVSNLGGVSISNVKLRLLKPSGFALLSSTPAAIQSGDTLIWNNLTIPQFQHFNFTFTTQLPANTPLGTPYSIVAKVSPLDSIPQNNTYTVNSIVVGSYDPNDKQVSDTAITPSTLNNYLTYTIRFQNTGTDTAFNVLITDTLSPLLDATTLRLISSSHACQFTAYGYGYLRFNFPNILLPDSTTNESASHGFVTYHIKPKSNIQLGETILNTAYIYFDYNAPIITNTTQTTHVLYLNNMNLLQSKWRVYPNPTSNYIVIESNGDVLNGSLLNVYGQLVWSQKVSEKYIIDLKQLSSGVYFLRLESEIHSQTIKLVLE